MESQRREQSTSPFLLCWLRLNISSHLLLPLYWDLWHLFHWFSGLRALNYITTFPGLQLAESSCGPSLPPLSFEVIPHNKSLYLYAHSCASSISICSIGSVSVESIPLTPQFKCKNVSFFPPNLKKLFGWVHFLTTFIIKGGQRTWEYYATQMRQFQVQVHCFTIQSFGQIFPQVIAICKIKDFIIE